MTNQMEMFSALLVLCEGESPVTGGFPHKGEIRGALMFLICDWTNQDAGDLRRHCANYDVIVMGIAVYSDTHTHDGTPKTRPFVGRVFNLGGGNHWVDWGVE